MNEQIDELSLKNTISQPITPKKQSSNAVFIVPQQQSNKSDDTSSSSSSISINQLINTFSPPSNTLTLNDDSKKSPISTVNTNTTNKLTLIPLNLNQSINSPIKIPLATTSTTTPIKNDSSSTKTIISPIIGTKKVIISTPNTANSLKTTSDVKPVISSLNNTKIFTISTQNSIKTLPTQQTTNLPTTLNTTSLNTTNSNVTNNQNKIQYVKIVNTVNNTQKIQMQNIPTSVALANSNGNKAIKITTISTNTNNNAITTTTTNNTTSQIQLSDSNSTRSVSSVVPTVTPISIKQTNESTSTMSSTPPTTTIQSNSSTSALFEAINSNGQTPNTNSAISMTTNTTNNNNVKLHTYQLVTNNSQQPKITTTTKTPVIQRIQYNNQPITKTIVSATTNSSVPINSAITTTTTTMTSAQPQINNYKVLSQQLPSSTSSSQFPFKSLNTNTNANKVSITKTIPSTSNSNITNSLEDLTTNRKQIITTVRNGDHTKQTITQVASNSNVYNPLLIKNTTPITISTNITTNQSNSDDNQKSSLETFAKIFNTASPSTLASSSSSPNKQRITNLNRNDQSLASPPSQPLNHSHQNSNSSALHSTNQSSNNRKPCNCTKSMCLKLYCDCFAIGSFCHDCNCINCFNTLEHEDERNKAIKMVLDRNPQAFQSKIGKFTAQITLSKAAQNEEPATTASALSTEEIDEIQSRHIKGCNCKKSNCLKRYCECYLAKIQCSTLCKCVGCKNCDESTKALIQLANASDLRKQQQQQQQQNQLSKNNKLINSNQQNTLFNTAIGSVSAGSGSSSSFWRNHTLNRGDFSKHNSFNNFDFRSSQEKLEQQQNLKEYAILTDESIEVTCSRLIEKVAEEFNHLNNQDETEMESSNSSESDERMEALIIEEFGRCLVNLIDTAEKRNKS